MEDPLLPVLYSIEHVVGLRGFFFTTSLGPLDIFEQVVSSCFSSMLRFIVVNIE